jgi:hypothetical protein
VAASALSTPHDLGALPELTELAELVNADDQWNRHETASRSRP